MGKKRAVQKVKQFAERVRAYLPECEVFLYGSYARGNSHEYSDVDVAVVVDEYRGDLFEMKATLCRLAREVDVLIEPLLIERKYDPANFLSEIENTGKSIAA